MEPKTPLISNSEQAAVLWTTRDNSEDMKTKPKHNQNQHTQPKNTSGNVHQPITSPQSLVLLQTIYIPISQRNHQQDTQLTLRLIYPVQQLPSGQESIRLIWIHSLPLEQLGQALEKGISQTQRQRQCANFRTVSWANVERKQMEDPMGKAHLIQTLDVVSAIRYFGLWLT